MLWVGHNRRTTATTALRWPTTTVALRHLILTETDSCPPADTTCASAKSPDRATNGRCNTLLPCMGVAHKPSTPGHAGCWRARSFEARRFVSVFANNSFSAILLDVREARQLTYDAEMYSRLCKSLVFPPALQRILHSLILQLGIARSLPFVAPEIVALLISTDVQRIYEDSAEDAARYLQLVPGALHLALDGWTSPTHESYLGVVIFWYAEGKIWRSILEFIRLTKAHTGDYLAERVKDCLTRFGIEDKILSICADNAGNNDTLSVRLHEFVPTFDRPSARTRCFAHILNLMAKAFMSLFSAPPRRSKGGEPSPGQRQTTPNTNDPNQEPDDSIEEVDPDKLEHDDGVIKGVAMSLGVPAA
ncbi:hAT family dimerization protein [Ceratobasidium sp. AG-Ba]|nr:hAT family dimerization protein [Ceratobasidium sp. AG-Ba]